MYSKDLEQLIDAALADGIITDKERAVIKKRAEKEGIDLDEIDVYLDGRLAKLQSEKSHIVNEAPKIQQAVEIPQKTSQASYTKYWIIIALCVFAIIASQFLITEKSLANQILDRPIDKNEILGRMEDCAKIATTEVKMRRIGILDPDSENVSLLKPSSWKIGERGCVVPVDITIQYGIKLEELKNSIEIDSSQKVVKIKIPTSDIIEFDMARNYPGPNDVVRISDKFREEIGEQTIQKVKMKARDEVLNDTTLKKALDEEINYNTRRFLGTMISSMGLNAEFVN